MVLLGISFCFHWNNGSPCTDCYYRFTWDLLRGQRAAAGSAILLTTHSMEEAETLADYVYIMVRPCIKACTYIHDGASMYHGMFIPVDCGCFLHDILRKLTLCPKHQADTGQPSCTSNDISPATLPSFSLVCRSFPLVDWILFT